mgnify:FL=1
MTPLVREDRKSPAAAIRRRKNSEGIMKRFVRYILNWYHVHDGLEILLFAVCWSAFIVIGYTFISEIVNRILT